MFVDKKQKNIIIKRDNHKVKYGFIDSKNRNHISINISSWVEVINEDELDYSKMFRVINKEIKQYLSNPNNNTFFDYKHFIVDTNIRQLGFVFKTKSYLDISLVLFNKTKSSFPDEAILKQEVLKIINKITEKYIKDNSNFKFSLTK